MYLFQSGEIKKKRKNGRNHPGIFVAHVRDSGREQAIRRVKVSFTDIKIGPVENATDIPKWRRPFKIDYYLAMRLE